MRVSLIRYGAALLVSAVIARAQTNDRAELGSLRQDVLLLRQQVGELAMAVEQLTRDNAALQAKASQSYVTLDQLNKAIADTNRVMQAALGDQKKEVLAQVAGQLEKLGRQTNAALDALAKSQATRPAVQTSFSEDFPKEGINYTVQAGDTLSGIAKKTGGKLADIRNANRIADDAKIRTGQTLFIPQGK
ncbi:MAG TPA: LysM peptidoglycan-binding domain-containing protein [Lacunisphaera sp.]|nr:LysM peptidoglycan-binding domain-containing protein [Lacunisphaera sp.]